MTRALLTCLLILLLAPLALSAQEPCGISLRSVQPDTARPGDTVQLMGTWGNEQGRKVVVMNKGGSTPLEVLAWWNSVIRVRVPYDAVGGSYKVGVYCNPLSDGRSYSSGFKSLRVLDAPAQTNQPRSTTQSSSSQSTRSRSQKPTTRPKPVQSNVDEPKLWEQFWWVILLLIPILFRSGKSKSISKGISQSEQLSTQGSQRPDSWSDSIAGVAYSVACYSADTYTVEINLDALPAHRYEINARQGHPGEIDSKIRKEAQALLNMGATYLDVGYNTSRIAAEFPLASVDLTPDMAKHAAKHLVFILKKVS